jgi:hypothetical protein
LTGCANALLPRGIQYESGILGKPKIAIEFIWGILSVDVDDRKRPEHSSRPQSDGTQSRFRNHPARFMVALIFFPQGLRQHAAG